MTCRACSATLSPAPLLRLPEMPLQAQNFPLPGAAHLDRAVPLEVFSCEGCGLIQLPGEPVPYFRDVIRAASVSREMQEFRLKQFREFLTEHDLAGKSLLEAGCGRGEYALLMRTAGARVHGLENLESSVEECRAKGIPTTRGFLEDIMPPISEGPFDAFFTLNFLEHMPQPGQFLRAAARNLKDGAIGLVEVPNFEMILREKMFSEFIRDHLLYFTGSTLSTLLAMNGFEVLEIREVWKCYILSATVRKRRPLDLSPFEKYREKIVREVNEFVQQFPPQSVAIWGAGHQALAVMALAKLGSKIRFVLDSAAFKQGRLTPATHIPVVAPSALSADHCVRAVLVMGSSYSEEILASLRADFRADLALAVLRPDGVETIR